MHAQATVLAFGQNKRMKRQYRTYQLKVAYKEGLPTGVLEVCKQVGRKNVHASFCLYILLCDPRQTRYNTLKTQFWHNTFHGFIRPLASQGWEPACPFETPGVERGGGVFPPVRSTGKPLVGMPVKVDVQAITHWVTQLFEASASTCIRAQ